MTSAIFLHLMTPRPHLVVLKAYVMCCLHTFLDPTIGAYMTLIFVLKMNIGLDFSLKPLVKLGKSLWSNWRSDLILNCGGYNKICICLFF